MSATGQDESSFMKLELNEVKKTVVEDRVSKSVYHIQEAGGNIDELFVELFGEPCTPLNSTEQQERELRKKRQVRQSPDGEIPEERNASNDTAQETMLMVEEKIAAEFVDIKGRIAVNLDDNFSAV